jgi:hypothetical protein
MKRYMLMHIGFEQPTPEVMAAWRKWFEQVSPRTIENVGLRSGREIRKDGVTNLAMGPDAITGYTIVSAASLDEAQDLASTNPFVGSIRIYEMIAH